MEPECSVPCSQEPVTGLYPKLEESSPYQPILLSNIDLNIILHLSLILPSRLFSSCFPTKNLHVFLVFLMRTICPAYIILFDLVILIIFGEKYKLWSSTLYNFLQHSTISSLSNQNILLSTLFSNTFRPCTFLNFRGQVLHTYKTTEKK
jgi:hypothetical protein